MSTRRHFQAVEQPQEHTESGTIDPGLCAFTTPLGRCRRRAGHGGDHDPSADDTTQQVAAISEPAEVLNAELQKRIQKVKLQHHALQRRMSPPTGIAAVNKKT